MYKLKGRKSKLGKEGIFGIRSYEDRYKVNKRMTENIKKIDYDPKKFGCTPVEFMTHEVDWYEKGLVWKGRCKKCGEEFEI